MPRRLLKLSLLAVLALALPGAAVTAHAQAPAANAAQADGLLQKTLYETGASGRFLMGGQWQFKLDPSGNGSVADFAANPSTAGWATVAVPNAWNAKDYSDASFT